MSTSMEVEIPVPWGHIAAKAWGNPQNEIVIAIHGLLDNAGSFDTLIPLLPSNFYYVCIDLPGHGFSSHFPSSLPVHFVDFVFALRYVTDHFKRETYILLSHSIGGKVAMLYAQMYSQKVSKLIVMDATFILPNPSNDPLQLLIDADKHIKDISSQKPTRTVSYEDAVKRVMDSRFGGRLTVETAEQMAKRMIRRVAEDKYQFTHDRRLRTMIHPNTATKDYVVEMYRKHPVRCPAILIYTTNTVEFLGDLGDYYFKIPDFELHEILGHHHSHHTNPELFVPILTKFLLNGKAKL